MSCETAAVPAITTALEPVVLDGERIGTIGSITIDNPDRRNAMTAAMYSAIPVACEKLCAEPDLRAVVLQGAGRQAFCAGSDISEFHDRRMG
ncbi:MAG: enoyl-CoA hydratase/isomerase family protein, partial [Acidimicrobiales bacterium]